MSVVHKVLQQQYRAQKQLRLNGHIQRTDIDSAPVADERVTVADGVYHRIGKMNIVNTSEEGITFNVGFGESELYSIWNAVSLQSIKLPVYQPEGGVPELISYILKTDLMMILHFACFLSL